MADTDILQLSLAVLDRLAAQEAEEIARGQVADWPDYRRRRGRLSAFEDAQQEIREAFRKRFEPDEEDEDI